MGKLGPEIAFHCRDLRKLVLFGEPNILSGVLETVGPTFECLESAGTWVLCEHEIELVELLCRKLLRVSLTVETEQNYADLLVSYGTQLKFAALRNMSKALCTQVAIVCPKIRCTHHRYVDSDDSFEEIQVLGSLLLSLSFVFIRFVDEDKLATA